VRSRSSGRCKYHREPGDNGKDERLAVKSFYDGLEYQYRLVKALSSGDKTMPLSPMEAQ